MVNVETTKAHNNMNCVYIEVNGASWKQKTSFK